MLGMYNLYFPFCAVLLSIFVLIVFLSKRNVDNVETKIYRDLLLVNACEAILCVIIVKIKTFKSGTGCRQGFNKA